MCCNVPPLSFNPFLVQQHLISSNSQELSPFVKISTEKLYFGTEKQPKESQDHVVHYATE